MPTSKKRTPTAYATDELMELLVRDMTWQTNLNHEEREHCLSWAVNRFEQCLSQAQTEARATLRTVNELLGRPNMDRADVVKAILGEV